MTQICFAFLAETGFAHEESDDMIDHDAELDVGPSEMETSVQGSVPD
jgi:hypothetical protein